MLLNNQWTNDQIKTEIKQYMETNEKNNSKPQLPWEQQRQYKRKVYSNTGLSQERRTIPNEQSKLRNNETRKRTNEAQSQQKEGYKTRQEINKIEKNKTIDRINETRSRFFEKINKEETKKGTKKRGWQLERLDSSTEHNNSTTNTERSQRAHKAGLVAFPRHLCMCVYVGRGGRGEDGHSSILPKLGLFPQFLALHLPQTGSCPPGTQSGL